MDIEDLLLAYVVQAGRLLKRKCDIEYKTGYSIYHGWAFIRSGTAMVMLPAYKERYGTIGEVLFVDEPEIDMGFMIKQRTTLEDPECMNKIVKWLRSR